MTLTAFLDITLKPEVLDTAPAIIHDTLSHTRAFEGNLGVEVITDVTDPHHLVVVEHWQSIEADQAYRAWRATPEGASPLGSLVTGPPKLTKFTDLPGI
ncbi:putative quinol monooxygenase [Subtercola lobariae]|nr:antibiotic biosynthesis monooxygenase [Subtercola lobariae]